MSFEEDALALARAVELDAAIPLPSVGPIGIVLPARDFDQSPRVFSRAQQALAIALLVVVLFVTVVTAGLSLGRYCLTTDASDTRAVPAPFVPQR